MKLHRLHRPEPLGPRDRTPPLVAQAVNVSQGSRSVRPARYPTGRGQRGSDFSLLAGWMILALEQAAAARESSSYPSLFSVVGCNSASSDGPRFSLTVFSATPLSPLLPCLAPACPPPCALSRASRASSDKRSGLPPRACCCLLLGHVQLISTPTRLRPTSTDQVSRQSHSQSRANKPANSTNLPWPRPRPRHALTRARPSPTRASFTQAASTRLLLPSTACLFCNPIAPPHEAGRSDGLPGRTTSRFAARLSRCIAVHSSLACLPVTLAIPCWWAGAQQIDQHPLTSPPEIPLLE